MVQTTMASTKRSDGEGSLYYEEARDRWVGVLVVGWRDGKPVRKKVIGKSKAGAASKLRQLREDIAGRRLPAGKVPTVQQWMTYWLTEVVPERNRPSTTAAYGTYVNRYIVPLLGSKRLDRLTPEQIGEAWKVLAEKGCPDKPGAKPLSSTTIHQAHVILARALKVAMQRGYLTSNPTALMDAPSVRTPRMEVLTREHAKRVVEAAREHRNAARWTVAFTLGLRQGEALGLRWTDVDLERGVVVVANSLGRVKGQGLVLGPVKSRAVGERTIALPRPLLAELKAHRTTQNAERLAAGTWWRDLGYVFANADGSPIDPKADWTAWKLLLDAAGAPDVRLHAARHTAITMLLAMGVPPQVVKEIAGHAKFSTTEVYVDKVDELHLEAAEKMAAFWD